MKPMQTRVAVVTSIPTTIRAFLLPQITALRQAGFEVFGVCSDGEEVASLQSKGLQVITIPIRRSFSIGTDLCTLFRLWRLFRKARVDVVHTHTPKAALLGQIAAALARVPVRINTVHGFYYIAFPPGPRQFLFRWLELVACRLATKVICVSKEDAETIERRGWISPERVCWIGNGIDLSKFCAARLSPTIRATTREKLGIPADAFVVGAVCRLVREKGVQELLEAFARLRSVDPSAYLLHVGPADSSRGEGVSTQRAKDLGIEACSRFVGHRDDIPELLAAMDVFCLPSYREGFPVSVLEASAMGLPVVVTDIRGCREAVTDDVNGLIVPPREVEPLVVALKRLRSDPSMRSRLGAGGRERARGMFDQRQAVKQVVETYIQLAGSERVPQKQQSVPE